MSSAFVPAEKAYQKLQFAGSSHTSVYMYGATGYGKTKLIHECMDQEPVLQLCAAELVWDLSSLDGLEKNAVIVDDIHLLKDEQQQQTLLSLARRSNVRLVMAGRIQTPLWMVPLITDGHLIVISEEDLHLSAEEIKRIAANEAVQLDDAAAEKIAADGEGNAYAAASVIQMLKSGESFDEDLSRNIRSVYISHLEKNVIPQWSSRLQEFLMQVSVVDSFTVPLAVMITGDNYAPAMLEEALGAGNFLKQTDGVWQIRAPLIEALRRRALKVFGLQKYNSCIDHAGLFYEMQNDCLQAIRLYEASGNQEGIRSLLIRSARQTPGMTNLHALRGYYLALEEQEISDSPMLMSVMSMLYSIMMNPEKSEYWYEKLRAYAAGAGGGDRREADEQLLYLDIGLPHRGNLDMIDILKRAAGLTFSGGLRLRELSLTGNQPSTMNGGKDFCSWSRHDQFLADTIGKMVERLLGAFGRGLIHAALSESFYEKGGRDEQVLHHALMMQMEIDGGGKTDLLFASVGIQVRLDLLAGNTAGARKLLDAFEERVRREKALHLLPNLDALRCRVALVMGDDRRAAAWMEEAPDEQVEFWPMERYRYMTKVRCYLSQGQNTEAVNLLERMLYYAEVNQRPYIRMESHVMKAMALRQEKRPWKAVMLEGLNEIQEYAFVRILSEKGAGMLPLLREIRRDYLQQSGADAAWFEGVFRETKKIAALYPGYLVCGSLQPRDFGETAMAVLRMQSEGMSIRDIAAELHLSERTVKYHSAENYRKLGAKGKTDAVQIARNLHLL